jgi:hypothetical protein
MVKKNYIQLINLVSTFEAFSGAVGRWAPESKALDSEKVKKINDKFLTSILGEFEGDKK